MQSRSQQQLRKTLKTKRQQLSKIQHQLASARICKHLKTKPLPRYTTSYLASPGELNTNKLNRHLLKRDVCVGVPIVRKDFQMVFVPYKPFSQQISNQYGIKEPRFTPQRVIAKRHFSKVFIPLVGFDKRGFRIGMGGGYYDRWLASFNNIDVIGLAHNCQETPRIEAKPWDKRLDAIVTPRFWRRFNRKN